MRQIIFQTQQREHMVKERKAQLLWNDITKSECRPRFRTGPDGVERPRTITSHCGSYSSLKAVTAVGYTLSLRSMVSREVRAKRYSLGQPLGVAQSFLRRRSR